MPLDWIIFSLAVAYCVLLPLNIGRRGFSQAKGWLAKCILVLAAAGASWLLLPEQAPWITGGLWLIMLALPTLLARLANANALRARYDKAWRYARLVRLLHPFDGWRTNEAIIHALALAQGGAAERGAAALTRLLGDPGLPPSARPLIESHLCRLTGDWSRLAASGDATGRSDDPAVLSMRLRALGETGRLRELAAAFHRGGLGPGVAYLNCQLFLLAFCGRPAAAARLLDGPLAALDADTKAFWLGTAELAGGDESAGRARLAGVAGNKANPLIAEAASRRLRRGPASPRALLGAAEWAIVDAAEARLQGDASYIGGPHAAWRRSYAILALILLNLAAYLGELMAGATEDPEALARLGAMWPPAVLEDGEWWRLAIAMFLHFGEAHLVLNMVALAAIGIWVEQMLGHWRTLLVYLAAGLGSTAGVLLLMQLAWIGEGVLVGASGAIFGLVGAQLVLLAQGWRRLRSRVARQRLANLVIIILLQVAFDLSTPEVSFAAHALGLATGLAAAALLIPGGGRARRR